MLIKRCDLERGQERTGLVSASGGAAAAAAGAEGAAETRAAVQEAGRQREKTQKFH